MNTYFVFFRDHDWKVKADTFDIMSGLLVFYRDSVPVYAFNADKWDAVNLFDESE